MVAFAVSAHEEHFVDGVGWRSRIHGFDVLFELLPLCERFCQIVCRFISLIDQAKIGQGLAGRSDVILLLLLVGSRARCGHT